MRILVHQPRLSYFIGGGETVPLQQASFLSHHGHEVEILTTKPRSYSSVFEDFKKENPQVLIHELELRDNQKHIFDQNPGSDWSRWDSEAIFFGQVSAEFYSKARKYDLVVTHLLSDSLFVPFKFKNVLHLHGVPSEIRSFDKIFLNRPDHLISVSEFVKKGWESLYPELNVRQIDVAYNGIDSSKFINKHQSRDIDMLFVGRLIPTKGIDYIIQAIGNLEKDNQLNGKLFIVGKGPESERIQSLIHSHKLENKVEIVSDIPTSKLIEYYNRSKLFLCPSYDKEGVLTTMLEAASCGSLVITADCCGMIEFAKDKENALVVKPKNSEELAKAIQYSLSNDNFRQKIADQGEKNIKENWDINQTLSKLNNIYENYVRK